MRIEWLGHSCFKLTSERGISIITDPFDESVGYDMPRERADIVTVSHEHFDHSYAKGIEGQPEVVSKIGNFYVKDIPIQGIKSYHDGENGKKRGANIIYKMLIDDVSVCHLGDLGHLLNAQQAAEVGDVDVLLIPVGGTYTIDAKQAVKVVEQLNPRMVIPMHYKTPRISFPIDGVESFLREMNVQSETSRDFVEIEKDHMDGRRKVLLLNYE